MSNLHSDKRFVVTGAASGVGAALARLLRAQGAYVIGLDINDATGICDEAHTCNLAEPDSIDQVVNAIAGPIHGLANVAGVPGSAPIALVAKVNFLGLRQLTARLLPRIADGGCVINVASTAGANWRARKDKVLELLSTPDWSSGLALLQGLGLDAVATYDFTKEAVILYTGLVSSQERHRGVRVNSLSPGAVQTPILQNFYDTMGADLLNQLKHQAGGRDARPEEIASAISLLMDEGFFWMNGTDIIVDGGAEVLMNLGELATAPRALQDAAEAAAARA